MKLRTNRVKTIIIFIGTLLLGVTTLAISWRLQQEKQITEEEASANSGNAFWCTGMTTSACGNLHSTYYSSLNAGNPDIVGVSCVTVQYDPDGNRWPTVLTMGPDPRNQREVDTEHDSCGAYEQQFGMDCAKYFDWSSCGTCKKIEIINQSATSVSIRAESRNLLATLERTADNTLTKLNQAKSRMDFLFRILNATGDIITEKIVLKNDTSINWICTSINPHSSEPAYLWGGGLSGRHYNSIQPQWKNWDCEISYQLNFDQPLSPGTYTVEVAARLGEGYLWRQPDALITSPEIPYSINGVDGNELTYRQLYDPSNMSMTDFRPQNQFTWLQDSNNTCVRTFTVEPPPKVDCISKTVSPASGITVGDLVTYTVEYFSSDIEGNVTITDTLDARLSPGRFSEGCSASGQNITCIVDGNTSGSVVYIAQVTSAGNISNDATVSGGGLSDSTDCSVNFTAAGPDAKCLSKTIAPTGTIDPGQAVTFTVNWENGPIAGTILINDTIPNGFENVEVITLERCPTVHDVHDTDCYIRDGNIIEARIDATANDEGALEITATARSTVRDLETTNTATVRVDTDGDGTADDTADNDNTCSTGTEVSEANAVCESKTSNATSAVSPGDIVTYQIDYTVERGPATVHITDELPQYTSIYTEGDTCTLPTGCTVTGDILSCTITNAQVGTYVNAISFCVQVDETGIPLDGVTIVNNKVKVWEGATEPTEYSEDCTTSITVEHKPPFCIVTNPNVLTIRQQDVASTSIELTTTGDLGTHANLEFRWTTTGGTITTAASEDATEWHAASGTPSGGTVVDVVTWAPPADAVDTDTYALKAYVRPVGSTDETGISADECEATSTITALDLICLYLIPNDPVGPFPFDMTFEADIGGDESAAFTYDLDFDDGSTHYTGSGTVAAGTTIELPYIPPQSSPHTYDSLVPASFAPVLIVTNTETGEESICPTVLAGTTQSSWSIVKDSDVDTCVVANSVVAYSIIVTNTGDYTADLEEVRDTVDAKIDTATITNIRECDANGLNCTTYNKADVLSGRTITWPGRTFTAGESRKYMYNVTVSTAGDYYNIAEAVPTEGEIVRDDETFPTCTGKATPTTGALSSAVYAVIFASILGAVGTYVYQTRTGAQVIANVMGKTKRAAWRKANKKEAFERDSIRSSKKKA